MDSGCGPGGWCQDVADAGEAEMVIGIDVSPIQHEVQFDNLMFKVGKLPDDLREFDAASFDLVHSRYVCLLIKS